MFKVGSVLGTTVVALRFPAPQRITCKYVSGIPMVVVVVVVFAYARV